MRVVYVYPAVLDVYSFLRDLIYIHILCIREVKALTRLCVCTGWSEPWLIVARLNLRCSPMQYVPKSRVLAQFIYYMYTDVL